MTKALFIVFHGFASYNGISKKILSQKEAFEKCGVNMQLCFYDVLEDGNRVWKIGDKIVVNYGKGVFAKIKKRICYRQLLKTIFWMGTELVYIRYDHNANPFTIAFVKRLKRHKIKTLLEIPTYPYDQEYKSSQNLSKLHVDITYRKRFAKYIDKIVTFTDYDEIFSRPTIKISNGIDFDKIALKKNINDISTELNLIGVAEIHFWHGFDRIIKGMVEYYRENPSYKVKFHIVGTCSGDIEKEQIETAIKESGISQHFYLYGNRMGEELDSLFEKSDLGIGSLARHRSGIDKIKTLKNREYAARGIPFIYSETDEDFDNKKYVFKVPANESPIDINKIIEFARSLNTTPQEIRDSISNLSWSNQIQIVLNQLDK